MRFALVACLSVACASAGDPSSSTETSSDLSANARLARETIIRDVAAQHGLGNGMLLAGLAEAEVHLAHCWSEATWACQGPSSSDCGGPVVAGSADGDCSLQRGGLGMFQFDRGNHSQTIAAHGTKILNVAGSTEEAVTFVVNMAINSVYTPAHVNDRASALAWLNQVTIDGPSYDTWIKTVVHYYNGCVPGQCSVYQQRWQKYDTAMRTVLAERGAAFWSVASSGGNWVYPLEASNWQIDFNIVNPYVPGSSSCFNRPMNQLVHAGEDWARGAGAQVRAIGAGTVIYAQYAAYPGSVVVIRHQLDPVQRAALGISSSVIYSMYGHVTSLQVSAGMQVAAGQHIANVLDQGSNSHIHWEVRTAEVPQLCGYSVPGPGYTNGGTDARSWGYLDPTSSVALLAGTNPSTTCDNGVPIDGTACGNPGEAVEYVCKRPHLSGAQQWDTRACAAGATCSGNSCQSANACSSHTNVPACDATGGACAWYACANGCFPTGTPLEQVCGTDCASKTSVGACDATAGECAWYACANRCYATGTDINAVCGTGWSCYDSSWGTGQVWTCGGDGNRHKCVGGTPIVDPCAHGCMARGQGQDDLCVQSDPGWNCAYSSWGAGQLWTCSGGDIHECQGGVPVRVDCPAGCAVMPQGTNDYCW